ncbi:MAG TPA: hypothetical protein VK866_14170, partial [Acidimicrobiales bacterium]|nr:hypothetical protein [Acidimicrobiales bacterium]
EGAGEVEGGGTEGAGWGEPEPTFVEGTGPIDGTRAAQPGEHFKSPELEERLRAAQENNPNLRPQTAAEAGLDTVTADEVDVMEPEELSGDLLVDDADDIDDVEGLVD